MAASEGTWLAGKQLFLEAGYTAIDSAPPAFTLLVKKFKDVPDPAFCGEWERKQRAPGDGMTIFRTDQCPYIEDLTCGFSAEALNRGLPLKVIKLHSAAEVRSQSPSAYGTFNSTINGQLFSYCYLTESQADKRFNEIQENK